MELYAVGRVADMAHSHHDPILGPGVGDQHVGHGIGGDHQRMVSSGLEGARQAGEGTGPVVPNERGLPVHGLVAHDLAAEGLAQALVPQAHAEDRDAPAEVPDGLDRDPRVLRAPGAGRDDQRLMAGQLLHAHLVVEEDVDIALELAQVLDQVVGERVVVVDDGDPGGAHGILSAWAMASNMAPDLASVSSNSRAGTESATTPAPAWT